MRNRFWLKQGLPVPREVKGGRIWSARRFAQAPGEPMSEPAETVTEDTKDTVKKKLLKRVQRGLSEGKWYEVVLSEGYVNGEFREDVEFEAHSITPDQPTAQLVLIYDYLRFDFTKGDHNQALNLDEFPTAIESDVKFVVMLHEHDQLMEFGEPVEHNLAEVGLEDEGGAGDKTSPQIEPRKKEQGDQELGLGEVEEGEAEEVGLQPQLPPMPGSGST